MIMHKTRTITHNDQTLVQHHLFLDFERLHILDLTEDDTVGYNVNTLEEMFTKLKQFRLTDMEKSVDGLNVITRLIAFCEYNHTHIPFCKNPSLFIVYIPNFDDLKETCDTGKPSFDLLNLFKGCYGEDARKNRARILYDIYKEGYVALQDPDQFNS